MQEQEVGRLPTGLCVNTLREISRYATDIVRECAEAWVKLITGKSGRGGISLFVPLSIAFVVDLANSTPAPTLPSHTPRIVRNPALANSKGTRISSLRPLTVSMTSGSSSLARPSKLDALYRSLPCQHPPAQLLTNPHKTGCTYR